MAPHHTKWLDTIVTLVKWFYFNAVGDGDFHFTSSTKYLNVLAIMSDCTRQGQKRHCENWKHHRIGTSSTSMLLPAQIQFLR